ncbi:uncharacterized protein LOC120077873 isoform X2 [Benincasa hispida]|uniref:uncharacterized protein LOC120077873 isoform X2 n=1 Tax=Benincasa hispida TaxID=102211 RepID=UPI00190024ED|nr:uncharacterized protein LOC120077873 isoform X2 [Benincasa hispida]
MDDQTQAVNSSTSGNSGEDFYEMIEAPKFVDFTVSDHYIPDDRYWFCSRVGCEQMHPEEMDSDVVYKNFVMRVMAARSPNVRLQRARRNLKCPLTAPPKSSKSRVARLALISSISKRIVDARVKSRPPTTAKPATTANVKLKQAHAKAMTTPRNRKLNSNTNYFLSVTNSKTTSAEEPKTTKVAKVLVFQSPKKDTKKRTPTEMNTPVKTICAAMKKLEITGAKKNVLGDEKNALGDGQSLPQDVLKKKFRGREVKSRVFDSLRTHSSKCQDVKSVRALKRRSKEKKIKPSLPDHVAQKIVDEDTSDMDIDVKSRQVSMQGCSLSISSKSNEGNPDELSRTEDPDSLSKDSNVTSISNSEERFSEKSDLKVVLCEVEDEKNQEYYHEERVKPGASELLESDDKENAAEINEGNREEKALQIVEPLNENTDQVSKNSRDDETKVLCEVEHETNNKCNHEGRMKSREIQMNVSELESDDKENIVSANKENAVTSDDDIEHESETTTNENVAPNYNRENNSQDQSERLAFGKLESSKNAAKVKGVLKKTVKEKSTPAAVGSHGLKPSRPKSTNPKPFRLRTDERGVLREANLAKKLNCPLKDITASRRFHGDKLERKNQYAKQNSECENHVEEEHEQRMLENKTQDDSRGGTVPDSLKNAKEDFELKLCTMDSQNCVALKHKKQSLCRQPEPGNDRSTKKTEDNLKTTKLEEIQQRVRKPRRRARNKTSMKISSEKASRKPSEALSRKRRPAATIPKEPNLHSNHLPRRAAQENCLR